MLPLHRVPDPNSDRPPRQQAPHSTLHPSAPTNQITTNDFSQSSPTSTPLSNGDVQHTHMQFDHTEILLGIGGAIGQTGQGQSFGGLEPQVSGASRHFDNWPYSKSFYQRPDLGFHGLQSSQQAQAVQSVWNDSFFLEGPTFVQNGDQTHMGGFGAFGRVVKIHMDFREIFPCGVISKPNTFIRDLFVVPSVEKGMADLIVFRHINRRLVIGLSIPFKALLAN